MSRPFSKFRSLSLVILLAGVAAGCTTETIYTDVYSSKRSRFVPPVERTAATALPPETTTTTTTTIESAPVVAPAPVEMAPAPAVEVLPDAQPAPALPGMDAAAPAPDAAVPADGQMMQ